MVTSLVANVLFSFFASDFSTSVSAGILPNIWSRDQGLTNTIPHIKIGTIFSFSLHQTAPSHCSCADD